MQIAESYNIFPLPYHKWDFFIGRSTVDGTKALHTNTSPFIENLFQHLAARHATQVKIFLIKIFSFFPEP
jgi:hypothetical protein